MSLTDFLAYASFFLVAIFLVLYYNDHHND